MVVNTHPVDMFHAVIADLVTTVPEDLLEMHVMQENGPVQLQHPLPIHVVTVM